MQNIPRIFLDEFLETGKTVPANKDVVHYLRRVMRRDSCLVFNNGDEYSACLIDNDKNILIGEKTEHTDPSNNLTLYFAPIKRLDDLLNMATQMGVKKLQPVITNRTVANHINWNRMRKIVIEASEQSGRNSVPELCAPVKFEDLDFSKIVIADERAGHGKEIVNSIDLQNDVYGVFVGPEGGFSESEFEKMDMAGVKTISLGKTILRAEVAAVVAISKVLK